jgi:hypothetical protein
VTGHWQDDPGARQWTAWGWSGVLGGIGGLLAIGVAGVAPRRVAYVIVPSLAIQLFGLVVTHW